MFIESFYSNVMRRVALSAFCVMKTIASPKAVALLIACIGFGLTAANAKLTLTVPAVYNINGDAQEIRFEGRYAAGDQFLGPISSNSSWITATTGSVGPFNAFSVTLKVQANLSADPTSLSTRSAVISWVNSVGSVVASVTVIQTPRFKVRDTLLYFDGTPSSQTVQVTSTGPWQTFVAGDSNDIRVSPAFGTGNATVTISAVGTRSNSTGVAQIFFTRSDNDDTRILTTSRAPFTVPRFISFGRNGGAFSFNVGLVLPFDSYPFNAFAFVTPESVTTSIWTVTAGPNNTGASRHSFIQVTSRDGLSTRFIDITQN